MEGWKDWNKMSIEEHIEHLQDKFQFDSSGTSKSVYELIAAYRALNIDSVRLSLFNEVLDAWSKSDKGMDFAIWINRQIDNNEA